MSRRRTSERATRPFGALALVLVLSAPLALTTPDAAAAQQEPMTLVDLVEVPSVGDPQLSPDGRQIVFVRSDVDWDRNRRVSHIWRIGANGAGAVQLTNGEDGESSPRWSPDGAAIAFVAERGDDERGQIWLIPNAGGEARRLTDHATGAGDIRWSPDGQWIYFVASDEKPEAQRKREEKHDDVFAFEENYQQRRLWRVAVPTGKEERLTEGDYSVVDYSVSRDGSRLALERAPTPLLDDLRRREVYVMAAEPNAPMTQVTDNTIPESSPQLSPDNRTVLFLADSNERLESYYNDNIFLVDAAGGTPRALTAALPHEINGAFWSADGAAILFRANTGVRQELFRLDVGRDRITQLTEGDHVVGSWSYRPQLDRHVFTLSDPRDPGDVWITERGGRHPAQVTHVFDHLADRFRLPDYEVMHWPGEDGVTVEGILYYPLDYVEGRRYPLVVQTHGGPASSDKLAWEGVWDYVAKLTSMGYAVFKPNYRGSTGYGDDFLRDMVPGYFNQAHKDVMAGVDYLIGRGIVDGDRMAKMGWSAGGHMTDKIITYTHRFRAAASGAGAANWISMYAQSDVRFYRTPWFGGTPWQKDAPIDMYWDHSPLKYVANVTTPTIFLVGQNDQRVPMPQSVEMYRALKSNGVPTHLYVAPREPHGWREPRHQLFKANVELDWFEHWVRGRDHAWETAPGDDTRAPRTVTAHAASGKDVPPR